MNRLTPGVLLLSAVLAGPAGLTADPPPTRTPKAALQTFQDLIGSWRATGTPAGSRAEAQQGFWTETVRWEWQFRGQDAWLTVQFAKGKHLLGGELRYLPADDLFQLTVRTKSEEMLTFTGPRTERVLNLEREEPGGKETQRLVLNLLHPNRFLYSYEVRPQGKALFRRVYQVGATKEGVPFASGDGRPECVVSGGLGTIPVTYNGRTYYVCCGGCRTEFNADPQKYIREYEARKTQKDGSSTPR